MTIQINFCIIRYKIDSILTQFCNDYLWFDIHIFENLKTGITKNENLDFLYLSYQLLY